MASSSYGFPLSALAAAAAGVTLYAAYFDYRRQSDPEFRKQIKARNAAWQKQKSAREKAAQEEKNVELRRRAHEIFKEFRMGASLTGEELEVKFIEHITAAENLVKEGKKVDAAANFFRAFLVYPSKSQLLQIYSTSVEAEVLGYFNVMVKETVKSSMGSMD